MRGSLGGGSNMGGGRGGGGGMLRSVHRAVRAGIGGAPPEPFSPSTGSGSVSTSSSRKTKRSHIKQPSSPNRNLTLSNSSSSNNSNGTSAFSSLVNLPISAASGAATPTRRACPSPTCEDLEWEYLEGSGGDERLGRTFYDDYVFAAVPSRDEVLHAVSALQQVAGSRYPNEEFADESGTNFPDEDGGPMGIAKSISSDELESDWVEPSPYLCDDKMLQPQGSQRVYDAFHLLQTDPSVQRMVISLSSDKAVWDAVLNNDAVRELRGSITPVDDEVRKSAEAPSDDGSNPLKDIMNWVFNNAREKIMELFTKITEIVHDIIFPSDEGKKDDTTDPLEEKLRTSLLLSVVVLLIVVISRVQSA
ncbi:hypothetical protein F511_21675 [Dorcoceras hygrometricum]|uniref:Uncharacterized protein n=1 Tax=Dorcoceras hygrometricum TaxID=472368 RepID=A0A2Z7B6F3_9LAMI|nr:hypothetical protein F511_21675 [Dorcoceras hygrometricum]